MTILVAYAEARAAAPETLLETFRTHMAEHGVETSGPLTDSRIAFPGAATTLRLRDGVILLQIEASDPDLLADTKATVAGHLDGFVPAEALGIVWAGDGVATAESQPHNFRVARVTRVRDVTPRMRRVTLAGSDLARFDAEALHVKILIPFDTPPGQEPTWPRLSPSGRPVLDGCNLIRRTYTIRRIDLSAGEMDIDFVLHGDASAGSRFAMHAAPGDWLGISGPGGGSIPQREWTLIAGDETALPAIARVLEEMPPDARGLVLIEVADAREEQALIHPADVVVRWLHRDGAQYGERLLAGVQAVVWPDDADIFAWAACEASSATAIRQQWRDDPHLPRHQFRAMAYWRKGSAEDGAEH